MTKSLKVALAIGVVVLVIFASWCWISRGKWQAKAYIAEGRAQKAEERYKTDMEASAKLYAELEVKYKEEAKARKALKEENDKLKIKQDIILTENADYKKKLSLMNPSQVVIDINKRIGEEASLAGTGLINMTIVGGKKTLSIFSDAETFGKGWENEKVNTSNCLKLSFSYETTISDKNKEIEQLKKDKLGCEDGWKETKLALTTTQKTLDKMKLWNKIENCAIVITVVTLILKFTKVI